MSNYLKRAVQRLLIQKRHRSYEERIARQAVPYGVWLESLLEGERAETTEWKKEAEAAGRAHLSVTVMLPRVFCECASDRDLRDKQGDLWLVTTEESALTEGARWEVIRYFEELPACGIAYGDEADYYKPDWSPDLLQSFFYFGNIFAVRKELVEKIGVKAGEERGH